MILIVSEFLMQGIVSFHRWGLILALSFLNPCTTQKGPQENTKGRIPIKTNFRINSDKTTNLFGSTMYINENMGQKIDTIIASLNVSDNPLNRSFKVFMLIAIRFP